MTTWTVDDRADQFQAADLQLRMACEALDDDWIHGKIQLTRFMPGNR